MPYSKCVVPQAQINSATIMIIDMQTFVFVVGNFMTGAVEDLK